MLLKLMVLHCQILFSLAIVAIAEAILMQISTEQVPSLYRIAPRYLKLVTSCNLWPFMLISATYVVCAVRYDLALFCADFHSICHCSVYTSVGEVLKLTIDATHKIDVVGKSWVTSVIGLPPMEVVMECFLHNNLKERIEQDG